jgi:uncharacterized protein
VTGGSRRVLASLALASLALGCPRAAPPSGSGQGPRVFITSPSGRESSVKVELARTPDEQERGLMFRKELQADSGMLFVFQETSEHAFWMQNTLIPLDLIFIGEDGRVVGIVANAEPLTTSPRAVGSLSRYVLEVNGGWSAAHTVSKGDRVRFEGL